MGKNIFEPSEVQNLGDLAVVEAPKFAPLEMVGETEEQQVYEGPTAEEIREEALQERMLWESERAELLAAAEAKANEVIAHAEQKFEDSKKLVEEEILRQKAAAQEESDRIITLANQELELAKIRAAEIYNTEVEKAKEVGHKEGYEAGFNEGTNESMRLVERIHVMINKIVEKRQEILVEVESQVVELTLLMVRKVVKVLSENQKSIVINNALQALKKIRGRGDVVIRVNMQDLALSSEHIGSFIEALERRGNITLAEDSSIEPGGCVIETDFGEIDARISSQLNEIEGRIRDLMPIVSKPKAIDEE